MLPALLAQIGLPFLVKTVSGGLRSLDNSLAQGAAAALDDVHAVITEGAISPEQIGEANRHIEKMAELESAELQTAIAQINETARAEVASGDWYVRRMRPTFGYIMAFTWAFQMLALAYVIVAEPESAGIVINAMDSLSTIWTVGLSVLGIYVYKRSQEKRTVNSGSNFFKTVKANLQQDR